MVHVLKEKEHMVGSVENMEKIVENQSATTRRFFIARIVHNEVRIDAGKVVGVASKTLPRKYRMK